MVAAPAARHSILDAEGGVGHAWPSYADGPRLQRRARAPTRTRDAELRDLDDSGAPWSDRKVLRLCARVRGP
jgi:hypothetical protein